AAPPSLYTLSLHDALPIYIAFGKPGATAEDVETAARAVHAHEFIERLPNGYDTEVGERGGHLSAGQRQLVAFARAAAADPRILRSEEHTSELQSQSNLVCR